MRFLCIFFVTALTGLGLSSVAQAAVSPDVLEAVLVQAYPAPPIQYECPSGKTIQARDVKTQIDVRDFILCARSYVEKFGIINSQYAFNNFYQWRSPGVYVFVDENTDNGDDATSYIYPPDNRRVGKTWGPLWDFFNNEYFQEVYRVVSNFDSGWAYYSWRDPVTRRPRPKYSYVANARIGRFQELDVVVGGGVYPRGTSNNSVYGTCRDVHASNLELKPSLQRLKDFVRCASLVYTESSNGAFEELSALPRWRSSSIYLFAVSGLTKKLSFNARESFPRSIIRPNTVLPEWSSDEAGLADRNVVEVAFGAGESFLYYKDINPKTQRLQRKVVFLKRTIDKPLDQEVLIGAGYYLEDDEQAHGQLSDCSDAKEVWPRSFTQASLVETREDIEAFVRTARCYVKNNDMDTVREAFHTEGKYFHENTEGIAGNSIYLWIEEFDRNYAGIDFHNAGDLVVYGHPTDGYKEEGKPWGRELIDSYKNSYYPEAYRMMRQQDSGWIYYSYADPSGKTSNFKSTFVALVEKDGKEYMVAAGLWDRSVPGACAENDINAKLIDENPNPTPRMLQDFVRCASLQVYPTAASGQSPTRPDPRNFERILFGPRWTSGSVYAIVLTASGYPLASYAARGYPDWDVSQKGPSDKTEIFPILNSIGEMFLHYKTLDPKANRFRKKLTFVQRIPLTNNYIGAGYYTD